MSKTSRMTPLPKREFGALVRYVFHPLSGVSALCFLYKNPRQNRPEALLDGVQTFSGERVLWYVFLPPYVLHPPLSLPKRTAIAREHVRALIIGYPKGLLKLKRAPCKTVL